MADSDNTTTLSLVTRRRATLGTTIAAARPSLSAFAYSDLGASRSVGPAVARGGDVGRLMKRLNGCAVSSSAWSRLIGTIGYPSATKLCAGAPMTIWQPIRQARIAQIGRWFAQIGNWLLRNICRTKREAANRATASNRNHTAKFTIKPEDLRAGHLHLSALRTGIRRPLLSGPLQWPAKC